MLDKTRLVKTVKKKTNNKSVMGHFRPTLARSVNVISVSQARFKGGGGGGDGGVQMQKLLTGHTRRSSSPPCQRAQLCFHMGPFCRSDAEISDAETRPFDPLSLSPAGRNCCFFDRWPGDVIWLSFIVRVSASAQHLLLTPPPKKKKKKIIICCASKSA